MGQQQWRGAGRGDTGVWGERWIDSVRQDALKEAPESLHDVRRRLDSGYALTDIPSQWNLWALSLPLLAPPHRCL